MVCHCECVLPGGATKQIQLDRDECEAPAATARFAHLRMNTEFVILNEVKNPRVACWREHGFFTSFRMTGKGQAVHLLPPRKPRHGLLRHLAMAGKRCHEHPFQALAILK